MNELSPILYIFIGVFTAGAVGALSLYLLRRYGLLEDPREAQEERVDLISAAALEIMKAALKDHDAKEEEMRQQIVALQAQINYLQQTVDGLSRQLREIGRVPKLPDRPTT